jgi:DNA modification methylase
LVAQKPGAACKWYDDSHKIENIIRPGFLPINKIIPSPKQHPTEKPIELMAHFIKLHTKRGDVVLDPFMGGGTTGVACKELGRHFIGIELSPEYCRMAERRIAGAAYQGELPCPP